MEEVYEFLKACGTYYLATLDGSQPRVRPFGTVDLYDGKLTIQTGRKKAVAKQMLDNLGSNPIQAVKEYASLFYTYIDTDLEVGELAWIGEQALNVGMENIHFYTLPGDGAWLQGKGFYSGSYYVLDPEATLALINESFNLYDQDLTLEDMDILVP